MKLPSFENSPKIYPVPTDTLPRNEVCPHCNVNLIEKYTWLSDRPADIMKVVFGKQYTSYPKSEKVCCPTCFLVYDMPLRSTQLILNYLRAVGDGAGFSSVRLKQDFLIDFYDTEVKQNIPATTTMYWPATPQSSISRFKSVTGEIFKIKHPWEKADGWMNNGKFSVKILKHWEQEPAALVHFEFASFFENNFPSNLIPVPFTLLEFPKEFYSLHDLPKVK